jgi:hypothetical protein
MSKPEYHLSTSTCSPQISTWQQPEHLLSPDSQEARLALLEGWASNSSGQNRRARFWTHAWKDSSGSIYASSPIESTSPIKYRAKKEQHSQIYDKRGSISRSGQQLGLSEPSTIMTWGYQHVCADRATNHAMYDKLCVHRSGPDPARSSSAGTAARSNLALIDQPSAQRDETRSHR